MKNDEHFLKDSVEDRPFTFKITKRRSPWTNEVIILITKRKTKPFQI